LDNDKEGGPDRDEDNPEHGTQIREEIYRPPRLAAMPYTEISKDKKSRRIPLPSALAALAHQDPSKPHVETTTGLATISSLSSNRAREIRRMTEFEEENFTRLVMKKKDAKQRRKDEADIALGGTGGLTGRRRVGGFDEEFADVLKTFDRSKTHAVGDGYEELRKRGKRADVLNRARTRAQDIAQESDAAEGPRPRKKSRFEKEMKLVKKNMLKRRKT
jgi:U3 small nucleolar ribonucleoprotein protein LCP5